MIKDLDIITKHLDLFGNTSITKRNLDQGSLEELVKELEKRGYKIRSLEPHTIDERDEITHERYNKDIYYIVSVEKEK